MDILKAYTFEDLSEKVDNVVEISPAEFHGACPVCEGDDPNGHHLYVKDAGDGKPPLIYCHNCQSPYEDLLMAFDDESSVAYRSPPSNKINNSYLKPVYHLDKNGEKEVKYIDTRRAIENYDHEYKHIDGSICYLKHRKKLCDGHKVFWFHYTDAQGQYVKGKPLNAPILYNLDKMNEASEDTTLYIVEGEKCADALTAKGLLATTSNTGAQERLDFTEVDLAMLAKFPKKVVIPDNDAKGQGYIKAWGPGVNVLDLTKIWQECPPKGDIADYVEAGMPIEAITGYEFTAANIDDNTLVVESTNTEVLTRTVDDNSNPLGEIFNTPLEAQPGYTKFPDQKLCLRAGPYITGEFGVIQNVIKGKDVIPIIVSPIPLLVTAELRNEETGEEKVELSFLKRGTWHSIVVNRSIIANKSTIVGLADIGLEVTSETAKFLVAYLDYLRNNNSDIIPLLPTISHLGWFKDKYQDKMVFIPLDDNYIVDAGPAQMAILHSIETKGSEEEWFATIKDERTNKYLRIVMAAAFAAPMLDILGANCFVTHVCGSTGAGKTVATMVAASIYGNPDNGKLVLSLNTTPNGINAQAAFLHNLPFFGNELQTLKNNLANQSKQLGFNFDNFIYNLCEGVDRLRANKSGGARQVSNWKTVFIFNGEEPIIKTSSDGGAVNRVIEINAEGELINNIKAPSIGRNLASFVRNNYGFAGKRFIERVQTCKDLQERLAGFAEKLAVLTDSTPKQVESAAILLLADSIAAEIFDEENPLTPNDLVPFLKGKETVSDAERAWEQLLCLLQEKANNFYGACAGVDELSVPRGNVWGNWNLSTGIVELNKKVLERELARMGFDFNAIKKEWVDKGHLIKTKGGWGRQTTIDSAPAYLVKLQL